ncbi:MAG: M23 family metallopeptidase, partial [Candidatus Thiodiazotropha endolucinida]
GSGHQGQDIRADSCSWPYDEMPRTDEVVAVEKGVLTRVANSKKGTHRLVSDEGNGAREYLYLHIAPRLVMNADGELVPWADVNTPKQVNAGEVIGYVSDIHSVPTTLHLHFEMKVRTSRISSSYRHAPPYKALISAYEKLIGKKGEVYKHEAPIPFEIKTVVFWEEDIDKPRFRFLNWNSYGRAINESGIFSSVTSKFESITPEELMSCIDGKRLNLGRLAFGSQGYKRQKIFKALKTLDNIRKRVPKGKKLTDERKLLKEYLAVRSRVIRQYNEAIVLCYRNFDANPGGLPESYPIFVNPVVVTDDIQKSVNWHRIKPGEIDNVIDVIKFIATHYETSTTKSMLQVRSVALMNEYSGDQVREFSGAERDMITLFAKYGTKARSDSGIKGADVTIREIGHWLGLTRHNTPESLLSLDQLNQYYSRDYKNLCESFVILKTSPPRRVSDSFEIRDRDWFTGVTDTATIVGQNNTVNHDLAEKDQDINCYYYQAAYLQAKGIDSSKLIDPRNLFMVDYPMGKPHMSADQRKVMMNRLKKLGVAQ